MSALPRGTYRITLTHEQSGAVAFDHVGLDAARVEQLMGMLVEAAPMIKAGQGLAQVWGGVERALSGLSELNAKNPAPRRAAARGKR